MTIVPCSLCGYHAPELPCPHCAERPLERSLARPVRGPLRGIVAGLLALPKGLHVLATTPGLKRWLVPPLIFSATLLVLVLSWVFSALDAALERHLPGEFRFDQARDWLQGLGQGWRWLASVWGALVGAAEWTVNVLLGLFLSPLKWLGWFLVGSLVCWYVFSFAYEAIAGPFLDEVQARIEGRWFGADPRSRLERPNDLPPERAARLTFVLLACLALLLCAVLLSPLPAAVLLLGPLTLLVPLARDRRYGPWLLWVLRVEGRALLASLQASLVTLVLLVLALPLYFVPVVGYFLFALVCGFSTAVGLLDIPLERRGWRLRQRLRFLAAHLPALIAFGMVAGLMLSVPLIGPALMVPAASIGGLWLVCRLDKGGLRRAAELESPQARD